MKSQRSLGLVVEGSATSSSVLRLPSFADELGPVKAGALRVARRLSNYMRAGYAVSRYEDLKAARLIFLRIPDAITPRIVQEICESELVLTDISFVLCETWLGADVLAPLRARGASAATLLPVLAARRSWFVVEGQVTAVRQVKRFLHRSESRVLELRPGTKPLYFAAQMLATALPAQLMMTAQQALRAAGISGNPLYDLLEEMSEDMFRSFANGVRLALPTGRTGCSLETCHQYLDHLRLHEPHIAAILDEQMDFTRRMRKKAERD